MNTRSPRVYSFIKYCKDYLPIALSNDVQYSDFESYSQAMNTIMPNIERLEYLENISSGPFYYYKLLTGHPYNIMVPLISAIILCILAWNISRKILKNNSSDLHWCWQYLLSQLLYIMLALLYCIFISFVIDYFTPFWMVSLIFYGLQVLFPCFLIFTFLSCVFRPGLPSLSTFKKLPNQVKLLGLRLSLVIVIISFYAWQIEPYNIELTHHQFSFSKEVPHLKVVHITDLQTDVFSKKETKLVQLVNEQKPDVIVLTGDYFNGTKQTNPKGFLAARYVLENIHAPYGIYAVSSDSNAFADHELLFSGLPISYLENSSHRIEIDDKELFVVGVSRRYPDIDQAFANVPKTAAKLLIYHGPEIFFEPDTAAYSPDLILVGHTHGGQVAMPFIGALTSATPFGRELAHGWFTKNEMSMYVNRGVGLEGQMAPKIRFLSRPELAVIAVSGQEKMIIKE